MRVIPSIDLLDGQVVRLRRGDFGDRTVYGDPEAVLDALEVTGGSRLHVVDLEGSRGGRAVALDTVRRLASRNLSIQVGGGVRSEDDVAAWLDAGAGKVVVGTIAADDPDLLRGIVRRFGAEQILPAVDVQDGAVRVAGWTRGGASSLREVLRSIEDAGISEILVTDIARDGVLAGPSFALYRELASLTPLQIIASGGVTTLGDIVSLARLPNSSGCVIGRALLDGLIHLPEAAARAASPRAIPPRIIPCLDVRDGRVVKGVNFAGIRDAGNPVACAVRYEEEGADEIAVLDISASDRGVATAAETVRRIAAAIFIPLTVGGGIRSVDDFRAMLRAGADRVAINTAAVRRPALVAECAREFGVQAVVVSADAKRRVIPSDREGSPNSGDPSPSYAAQDDTWEVMIRSGKEPAGIDVVAWCRRVEVLGAGEILLTSVDRDGTNAGFDIDLLRAVTAAVRINVIASGGAGSVEHFAEAIERGGATAALAASLFHDRRLTIGDVKRHLQSKGIPAR